ncbi:hypothetical protein CK911_01035 [Aeromonas sp. CU5]|nr:hypothetical protein CK911_01035 [Aeromonas sp. CU5]
MWLPAATEAQFIRCQLTIAITGWAGFHFTILIMRLPAGSETQITPLSADNRCHWMSGVPFHDTDNTDASGL